jgi:hypothetical protein
LNAATQIGKSPNILGIVPPLAPRIELPYLRIAQRLDLGFPLRLALSFKRRDVARSIRKDEGWVAISLISGTGDPAHGAAVVPRQVAGA